MEQFAFKGSMSLIFDPKIVCNIMMQNPSVRVVSLDEDNAVPMLCDENNPQVIPGTILLPPVEAMWAIVDEQMDAFAQIYYAHLWSPECMQYIAALLAAMYQGFNIILYFPDEDSTVIKYLYQFFQNEYKMAICTNSTQPFVYDMKSVPLYCNSIFSVQAMTPLDYLKYYPADAIIPEQIYQDIAYKYNIIPGDTLKIKLETIELLRRVLKNRPNARIPIMEVN